MKPRRCVALRIDQIKYGRDRRQPAQHPDRDLPGRRSGVEQPKSAGQKAQHGPFPTLAGDDAEHRTVANFGHGQTQSQLGAQHVERCGARQRVGKRRRAAKNRPQGFQRGQRLRLSESVRNQPGTHLARKRDQQHHIADHRRIERVVTQPAIQVFGDDDGRQYADGRQPPRRQRRQRHRQQPGRDHGAVVAQMRRQRLAARRQHRRFGGQRHPGGDHQIDQHAPAEKPDQRRKAGNHGVQHPAHDLANAGLAQDVRRSDRPEAHRVQPSRLTVSAVVSSVGAGDVLARATAVSRVGLATAGSERGGAFWRSLASRSCFSRSSRSNRA